MPPAARGSPHWTWSNSIGCLPAGEFANLQLLVYHDEDVEVYVNGVLAAKEGGFVNSYGPLEISKTAREMLKPSAKITLAVHCHQTEGGQGIDVRAHLA